MEQELEAYVYVLEVCVFEKCPRNRVQSPPCHWSLPTSSVNGLGLFVPEDSQRGNANIETTWI